MFGWCENCKDTVDKDYNLSLTQWRCTRCGYSEKCKFEDWEDVGETRYRLMSIGWSEDKKLLGANFVLIEIKC